MSFRNGMLPVHPGEGLREEYVKPLELSAHALAKSPNVPPRASTRSYASARKIEREISSAN